MAHLATNGLPIIEEEEATGEVAEIYDKIKRDLQMPFIPNMVKAIAASPEMLAFFGKLWTASIEYQTLPESLKAMISYTIAAKSDCTYCSIGNELTCRTLGVDEETLDRLVKDLGSVNPQRIRAIIEFALKVAKDPQGLVKADYDKLRDEGVTDAEIVEIIITAGLSVFSDIVADALQIEIEPMILEALGQMN